ncbi:ANTAR domain-containing response regulator, partial [Oleiphilus sp. HI0086]
EKAKGLLMKQKGLSEDEAYTSLRKLAMDKGQPIVKVAESIIDVFSLLGDVE